MKKLNYLLMMLGAVAALFASCSGEKESLDAPENTPIKMLIAADKPEVSRATPITGTTLPANSGFGMFIYQMSGGGSTIFQGFSPKIATAVSSTNVTLPGGPYYWPGSDKLRFFCYYPSTAGVVTASSSSAPNMTLEYTVPTNFNNQSDLLYAYSAPATNGNPVSLTFYHALTRVTFQVKVINNTVNFPVKVKTVKLQDVLSKGVFTVADENAPNVVKSAKSSFSYSPAVAEAKELGVSPSNDLNADTNGSGTDGFTNVFTSLTNNSFLMVPMTNGEFTGNASQLVITFTVDGKEKECAIDLKDAATNHEWPMGKHVNYRMQFDVSKELNALTINQIQVNPWGPQNNIDIGTIN